MIWYDIGDKTDKIKEQKIYDEILLDMPQHKGILLKLEQKGCFEFEREIKSCSYRSY